MRLFRFWPRQWGKRRALDLVATEIAELEQRSEAAADAREPFRHLVASGGWIAPATVDYGLLDLPEIGVRRGGFNFGGPVTPRLAPSKDWLEMGSIRD